MKLAKFSGLIVAGICVVQLPIQVAFATVPGKNGKIAYVKIDKRLELFSSEIYTVDYDGAGVVQMTDTPYRAEEHPTWSADGSKLFFSSSSASERGAEVPPVRLGISMMNADGSGEERLLSPYGVQDGTIFRQSPDSTKILLERVISPAISSSSWLMNSDGSESSRTTDCSDWSPDGLTLACGPFRAGILTADVQTKRETQLTSRAEYDSYPSFSPDGKKIVFTRLKNWETPYTGDDWADIYTIDADGKNLTQLTHSSEGVRASMPVFSPDGKYIAYSKYFFATNRWQIWVMEANGSEDRILLQDADHSYMFPSWQPLNPKPKEPDVLCSGPECSDKPVRVCNGTSCSKDARLIIDNQQKLFKQLKGTTRFKKGKLTVSGRLVNDSGQPIVGATIDVLQQTLLPRSAQEKIGQIKTTVNGKWKTVVKAGPSRIIEFAYRTYIEDHDYAVRTQGLKQIVRGDISLSLPRRATRGKRLQLKGSLLHGYLQAPKVVELQVFFKRKWRVFKTLRTNQHGTFSFRFSFGTSYRPGTWKLRARARTGPDWPFTTTVSKAKKIKIR